MFWVLPQNKIQSLPSFFLQLFQSHHYYISYFLWTYTWFCVFFVEVANNSFWGSNIGNCMFNLWQSEWYFLFCFIWLFAYLLQCQMHLFDMQISWHKIIHCIKSALLFQMYSMHHLQLVSVQRVFHFKAIFYSIYYHLVHQRKSYHFIVQELKSIRFVL